MRPAQMRAAMRETRTPVYARVAVSAQNRGGKQGNAAYLTTEANESDGSTMSETNHHSIDTATGEEADAALSEERVQHIFGTIAEQYKKFNAFSSFGLYKGWLRKTVDAARLTDASDLLDLAGGTGDVSYMAASRRPPAHIQLTDFVPEMLDVARERMKAGENNGVPVDFDVVDAQHVPYPDNSYDAVTMAYGIRNIPDRMQALEEVHRVLKPGGTFACLEFSTPPNALWRGLYHIYLKVMIPFWGWLFTRDAESFVYLADSIRAFPDQKAYAVMLREAGFRDVAWKNYAGGIVAVHTGRK